MWTLSKLQPDCWQKRNCAQLPPVIPLQREIAVHSPFPSRCRLIRKSVYDASAR